MASPPRITLYSARNCPNCRRVKAYLQQAGLRFQEFDVDRSARALKAMAQLGARAVPVLLVGDTRIDGFDRKRLDAVLKQASRP